MSLIQAAFFYTFQALSMFSSIFEFETGSSEVEGNGIPLFRDRMNTLLLPSSISIILLHYTFYTELKFSKTRFLASSE